MVRKKKVVFGLVVVDFYKVRLGNVLGKELGVPTVKIKELADGFWEVLLNGQSITDTAGDKCEATNIAKELLSFIHGVDFDDNLVPVMRFVSK